MHVHVCVCVCMRMHACVCVCMRMHACVCVCASSWMCVCVCVHACVCACVQARACVCVLEKRNLSLNIIYTHIDTFLLCLQECMHTYMYTQIIQANTEVNKHVLFSCETIYNHLLAHWEFTYNIISTILWK